MKKLLAIHVRGLKVGCAGPLLLCAVESYLHVKDSLTEGRARITSAALGDSSFSPPDTSERTFRKSSKDSLRHSLASNPLDGHALFQLVKVNRSLQNELNASRSIDLVGSITRRSTAYLQFELAAAVEAQDLKRAIIALDRLASVEPDFWPTILPVLAQALAEPAGQELLAERKLRPWFPAFVATAARNPESRDMVASFLLSHRLVNHKQRQDFLLLVANSYVASNDILKAQRFLALVSPKGSGDLNSLAWPRTLSQQSRAPLAWHFPNSQALPVPVSTGPLHFVLDGALGSAPIAQKVLTIPPGVHRISARVVFKDGVEAVPLTWKIWCSGKLIKQSSQLERNVNTGEINISVTFGSTQACTGYRLSLFALDPFTRLEKRSILISDPTISVLH